MAFSLLPTKILLIFFILELSGFSEVSSGLQPSVFEKPNCKRFLTDFAKPTKEEKNCAPVIDPVCASNHRTYKNVCEFCLAYKELQATIYFLHYGDC